MELILSDALITHMQCELLDKIAILTKKGTMSFNVYRIFYDSNQILHISEGWNP